MKTREQKIMQALKLYQKLFKMRQARYDEIETNLFGYLMDNVNNPNFLISHECDRENITIDEIYEGLMKQDIIYL